MSATYVYILKENMAYVLKCQQLNLGEVYTVLCTIISK